MKYPAATLLALIAVFFGWMSGCKPAASSATAEPTLPADKRIDLLFTYGSEKDDWVKAVTTDFNRQGVKTTSGKTVQVNAVPMGSGECIDTILNGQIQAHLTSPASAAFIKLGNAQSRVKIGKDLIGPTENLVLSPVVIAMWKPMAEALGWGQKPIGWAEILRVAQDPRGWASLGHPEWGSFRFGHTNPRYSNSGLISLFAEVYAATGKTASLTITDVSSPATADFLSAIESAVVHYGTSTGFFGKKLFASGPEYLSAAVLYENMVIESYSPEYQLPFPIVAIYPKEGTFWSDHPVGIVQREWVSPEHVEAAQKYIAWLLEEPQQRRALALGFRPASVDLELTEPIDAAHGVNPKEPQTTLEVPGVDVMDAILRLWEGNKKRSSIVLVFDVSGSMQEENKIVHARDGSLELLGAMHNHDHFSLLPFRSTLLVSEKPGPLGSQRERRRRQIEGLYPSGGTALYDAILSAFELQREANTLNRISAIVVLTDGRDTDSKTKLDELIDRIKATPERETIRVFTIGYGKDADASVLNQISEATQAKYYEGRPENIGEVFKDISTFF